MSFVYSSKGLIVLRGKNDAFSPCFTTLGFDIGNRYQSGFQNGGKEFNSIVVADFLGLPLLLNIFFKNLLSNEFIIKFVNTSERASLKFVSLNPLL